MSKKFNLKSAIEIAIAKEMDVPDEGTGLILHKFGSTIKQEEGDEFQEKRASTEKDLVPTQAEMEMINASARIEQDAGNWYVFRNVNVTGPLDSVDSHGDIFSMRAAKTMSEQVTPQEASPILTDHWHDLGDRPPIGKAITAKATAKGLIESWAIPKEDYNSSIVKGLLNGTINKISIGAFVNPADKLCNSCGNKSIYDSACPHIPNRKDEKGNMVTVTIKDVKRYAERSLVNIPARLGTSVKSLAPAEDDSISKEMAPDYDHIKETFQSFPTSADIREAIDKGIKNALNSVFDGSESEPPATIPPVISEDSIVAEKDVKAPEAEEPSEKEETTAPEAPVAEDKTEAAEPQEEVKSVEVPVVKSLEVEELTKSFTDSVKTDLESVNKTLADTNEAIKSFKELQDEQSAQVKTLVESVAALAEQVAKLAEFSTEEAVEKLLEVAGQIKEQQAPAPAKAELKSFNDIVDMLRK